MKGIIIGGGIIGLSIARELFKKGIEITVVDKDVIGKGASWVAGGMLAPQAEGLEKGMFLDLCLESREMYKKYAEEIQKETGKDVGYWECGILVPVFSEEEKEERLKQLKQYKEIGLTGYWLDRKDLESRYISLGDELLGGIFYPDDGQVDNRLIMLALESYVRSRDFVVLEKTEVKKIVSQNGKFQYIKTNKGNVEGDFCVICAGAWSGEIFDVPVFPIKGEMAAVDVNQDDIDTVFFGSKAYLIPRKNYDRLVIGATEEKVGFKEGNSVKGTLQLLNGLVETLPHMKSRNVQELWFGYRPATPDLEPILGESHIENVYLATGHHRNGILLAPITTKLISDFITEGKESEYLEKFSYTRFL